MKLFYFRGKVPNFGDELNTYVWPALLPKGFLDDDPNELMLGIGSIIGNHLPAAARKFVVGSGFAGYMGHPDMHDGTWEVEFVRGPKTTAILELPPEKAICDSAVLLRAMKLPPPVDGIDIAFMPHYESLERGAWRDACRMAGITLIDPTLEDVETILAQVRGARLLITEAMHGAIVADAVRTPWIGAKPIFRGHHMKWQDWSQALGIDLRMHTLKPTSMLELYIGTTGRGGEGGKIGWLNRTPVAAIPNRVLTQIAAQHLTRLADEEPQLSADSRIEEVTERAAAALDRFVRSRVAVS